MTPHTLDPGHFYGQVLHKYESRGVILSEINHKSARRIPSHAHKLAFFSLLLKGEYAEQFGTKIIVYKPMMIMFHPPDFEHQDEIARAGARFFSIELQRLWLDRLREYTGSAQISTELHMGELVWIATRLYREHKEYSDACSSLAIEGLLLEMLAVAGRATNVRELNAPAWLSRTVDLLRAEFQRSLTLDYISSAVGVNPLRLSRMFRKSRQQTISDFVNRLRVEHCCRLLLETDAHLADIALDAGFADQSHFTRIFKRVTSLTPKGFRHHLSRE